MNYVKSMDENFTIRQNIVDKVLGPCQLIYTAEMMHDLAMWSALMDLPKTGPIGDEEAADWLAALEELDKMDWKGAYERVKIERQVESEGILSWDCFNCC